MKNIPLAIYIVIALMIVMLSSIFKYWGEYIATNSLFAVVAGIAVPVATIIACIIFIKNNKI
jgi:hypothetical protein